MAIDTDFDVSFISKLAAEEKQIQQNYRPVIGVHKWFARRPGSLFRGLLLAEFGGRVPVASLYFQQQNYGNVTICDPFMGGGTSLFEANRVGCNVVGFDINPMAFWIVRQELAAIDRDEFRRIAEVVVEATEREIRGLYETTCIRCENKAPVKYFLWVKTQHCRGCRKEIDLFPGYLIAGNERHTHFVLHCPVCARLIEVDELPRRAKTVECPSCLHSFDWSRGRAIRNRYSCECGHVGRYPIELREDGPPRHRLFGIEYHCEKCRQSHRGRFFKTAAAEDIAHFARASQQLGQCPNLPIPDEEIPDGDETKRLHRWGYRKYREMFTDRQLLSLGILFAHIRDVRQMEARYALATVFSDFLRYQNMLCRYDTYALKCQDIFAVHGFPVGLVQCENNVLGIPAIGAGGFRHFLEKYDRAKSYCESPFETLKNGRGRKRVVIIEGERIEARFVSKTSKVGGGRTAYLAAESIENANLGRVRFDAVFTDPPYFDNVQYAELMDFCYVWLRPMLAEEFSEFGNVSTRSLQELTGNITLGRDLLHFTAGLSRVFTKAASHLRPNGPFVFTYHHNDIEAYVPIVVSILDAGLTCTATLPCAAEMSASLHINGTGSSIVDTIVVCRKVPPSKEAAFAGRVSLLKWLCDDRETLHRGGLRATKGDLSCLAMGHLARVAIVQLGHEWEKNSEIVEKMSQVDDVLADLVKKCEMESVVQEVLQLPIPNEQLLLDFGEGLEAGTLDEIGDGLDSEHVATGSK